MKKMLILGKRGRKSEKRSSEKERGGKKVKVIMLGMASMLLMGQTAIAGMPLISSDAFVRLFVDTKEIDLPNVAPFGKYSGSAKLNVQVISNRPYQVRVGFEGFMDKKAGYTIEAKDTALMVNRVSVPIGRTPVPVFRSNHRTTVQGIAVPLNMVFQLKNLNACPGGDYSGQFVVAIDAARVKGR